jgi:chemotaxis response regulator CheB
VAELSAVVAMAGSAGALQVMFDQVRRLVQPDSSCLFLLYHRGDGAASDWNRLLPEGSGFVAKPLTHGQPVEPGTIYYPASGVTHIVAGGRIEALSATLRPRPNLDAFLAALASEYDSRVLGILLSGWGRDGVQGMKAVRAAGGTAIIQDPATAEVGQLPSRALAEGVAHKVLGPPAIVEEVAQVLRGAVGRRARK